MKCPECGFIGDRWNDWNRNMEFFPTFFCPKCNYTVAPPQGATATTIHKAPLSDKRMMIAKPRKVM